MSSGKFRVTGDAISAVLLAALLVLVTAPATATTARVAALGGGDFIEDDHNVQRWYGSLGDYPGLVALETGHFSLAGGWHDSDAALVSGPALGVHLPLGTTGNWGIVAFFLGAQSDDVDPGGLARDRLGTTWSAMWSRRFGDLQPALIYRRAEGDETEALGPAGGNPVHRTRNGARQEIGAGLRWDLGEGAYLDLAGELRRHCEQTTVADDVLTVTGAEHSSQASFGLRGRAFVRLGEATALVPTLEYLREDRVLPPPSPTTKTALDGHLVKLGTGLNWYPDPDHFLVLGLDFLHADADYLATPPAGATTVQSSRSWNSLSASLGFESRFRYWLTFRGSLRYEPVEIGSTTNTGEIDFATFMVNFGAAIQLGPYDLDLAVTDQEPRSVSGYFGNSLFGTATTWVTATLRRTF